MQNKTGLLKAAATFLALAAAGAPLWSASNFPAPPAETLASKSSTATAVLAGGCFWGIEAIFESLKGVKNVVSGYSGGDAKVATYELVSTGNTGHAESVQITYDPSVVTYGTLLKVYFSVAHDPTQLNYQGPDHGTQYRSAIFYANDEQKRIADAYIKSLTAAKVYKAAIVTQVVALKAFYPAEEYHQNFMANYPDYPYIVYWDRPKMLDLNRTWPELVAKKYR